MCLLFGCSRETSPADDGVAATYGTFDCALWSLPSSMGLYSYIPYCMYDPQQQLQHYRHLLWWGLSWPNHSIVLLLLYLVRIINNNNRHRHRLSRCRCQHDSRAMLRMCSTQHTHTCACLLCTAGRTAAFSASLLASACRRWTTVPIPSFTASFAHKWGKRSTKWTTVLFVVSFRSCIL